VKGVLVFPRASVALVRKHAIPGTRIIAVDGGADACLAADVVPMLVVGDMDSVRADTLTHLARRGARLERHPTDKRDTDAALALLHVQDCDEVLFVGAGGGRPDHALANLHLLAGVSRWAQARAVDDDMDTWVVSPERPLELREPVGAILSAVPFDALVEGITYEGLVYPLTEAAMRAGDPYGVSNVASAPQQRIRVTKGRLFVMRPTQTIS
jgi:thiamine pyrophosphokinase